MARAKHGTICQVYRGGDNFVPKYLSPFRRAGTISLEVQCRNSKVDPRSIVDGADNSDPLVIKLFC